MARDVRLIRSPISVAGMVLTTISAAVFVVVFLADLFGLHTNPYIGILFFLVLPAIFLVGLALIPLGAWVERRRRRAGRPPTEVRWPVFDLNDPARRTAAVIVFTLTIANVVIVSLAAYRGVEYMDSPEFCGAVCHQPMGPEWAAYQQGPHAEVPCVDCHVGTEPGSFIRAKLAGTRRVIAVMFDSYPRPVPSPSHQEMVPASQTCQQCHWPERFLGDRLRRVAEYADDETNTESITTLQMHVGGGGADRLSHGIHWHANPAVQIDYVAGEDGKVPYVRVQEGSEVREYYAEGATAASIGEAPRLRMACMDCHTRPAHQNAATPERAVNESIFRGDIPKNLPFVHREAVQALKADYATRDAAIAGVADSLTRFYQGPAAAGAGGFSTDDVSKAVRAVQGIAGRNLFPEMHVGFGTYPSQLGHTDTDGCFRCHDENHTTADGKTISQDCELCHALE
jgi:nitrate/TMAO reductase-like tetraheme cytochrome c subunit